MLKEIVFNSARTGNSNNPTFVLRQPVYAYAYKVQSVSIPFSFYIVNSNNNVLKFREASNGAEYNAVIEPGNYDAASILTALGDAMTSAGGQTYTVSYNEPQGTLTISAPGGFRILSGNNGSTAWNILGVDKNIDSASGTSITLPNYVDFSFNSSILLCSNALSSEDVIYSSADNTAVLTNVPAVAPAGSVIHYDNPGGWLLWEDNIQTVDFMLLDSATGHKIDLNGAAFTVVLAIVTSPEDLEIYR